MAKVETISFLSDSYLSVLSCFFEVLVCVCWGKGCRKAAPDHSFVYPLGTRKKVDLRNKGVM